MAVKDTCWAGETDRLKIKGRLSGRVTSRRQKERKRIEGMKATQNTLKLIYCGLFPRSITADCLIPELTEIVIDLMYVLSTRLNLLLRLFLGQVLWDRNPGFLKSEIGPFSDFKRKSYLMDLKSAHSQEYDFQESGEVDRFLKMGTHFQERSGSLENGLCVTWSGFWLCPGYLWLIDDTCCSGANL